MTTAALPPVATLTDDAMLTEAEAITDKFYEYSESDPFGWDWPTMFVIFPDDVNRYRELQAEWKRRHPTPPKE